MNWYTGALKKYLDFSGRAQRMEYWMFTLINFLIMLGALDRRRGHRTGIPPPLYALAVFIPSIAVAVRRLHDTSRSGWWLLISLVPLVGFIVLIVFFVQDSQPGANEYGPNPKGA